MRGDQIQVFLVGDFYEFVTTHKGVSQREKRLYTKKPSVCSARIKHPKILRSPVTPNTRALVWLAWVKPGEMKYEGSSYLEPVMA